MIINKNKNIQEVIVIQDICLQLMNKNLMINSKNQFKLNTILTIKIIKKF